MVIPTPTVRLLRIGGARRGPPRNGGDPRENASRGRAQVRIRRPTTAIADGACLQSTVDGQHSGHRRASACPQDRASRSVARGVRKAARTSVNCGAVRHRRGNAPRVPATVAQPGEPKTVTPRPRPLRMGVRLTLRGRSQWCVRTFNCGFRAQPRRRRPRRPARGLDLERRARGAAGVVRTADRPRVVPAAGGMPPGGRLELPVRPIRERGRRPGRGLVRRGAVRPVAARGRSGALTRPASFRDVSPAC